MIVVLAEKPSVARDIAAVLGASQKHNGYFEGNNYQVTYAFGHLVAIAEPEQMNPAWGGPWNLAQLPMIPVQWLYRVADKAQEQFDCIKKLFLHPATTGIICATDAGREGQHIFDLIYQLTGSTKPGQRLWISSLTPEAIRAGFRNLKPMSAFASLSAAAAQAVLDHITPFPSGSVTSVVTTEKITKAPQLFDLLSLQKECNKRLGYTAQETLDLAQSLYEEYKILSYPRTESRYLSNDM